MKTAYVSLNGAYLQRRGQRLLLMQKQKTRASIAIPGLEQLVIMGNITMSNQAIDLLMQHKVDTVLLTQHGRLRARIGQGVSGHVLLRMAQYRAQQDPDLQMRIATALVEAKLHNQRAHLLRVARRHPDPRLNKVAMLLRGLLRKREQAQNPDSLRGLEGAGAAAYFSVFSVLLRASGFSFSGRNRRPPMDPVNALLSLGYTLLANQVRAAIEVVGLDPHLGFLHAMSSGRPSLALDLMEEYRAVVVDALVVAAINRSAFRPNDFQDMGPGEPVVIKEAAIKKFFEIFGRRMEKRILYEPLGTRITLRQLFLEQARAMARAVLGEADSYQAYLVR